MSAPFKKPVSKAVLALRAYLASAPQEELDANWNSVKKMGLPNGHTVVDLIAQQATMVTFQAPVRVSASFVDELSLRDTPADEYSYAMAA